MESPQEDPKQPPKSYGNMGAHHWTRSRADRNRDAIDYYRRRSRAPGVAEGGGPRNHYCMHCDGVIPLPAGEEEAPAACPHCGEPLEGVTKRYFNWVEIDEPPRSDLAALLPYFAGAFLLLGALLYWILF